MQPQPEQQQLQYNNAKNNTALLNGSEIVVMALGVFAISFLYIVHRWTAGNSENFYRQFIIMESALMFVYNVVCPIVYLSKKREVRKYMFEYLKDIIN